MDSHETQQEHHPKEEDTSIIRTSAAASEAEEVKTETHGHDGLLPFALIDNDNDKRKPAGGGPPSRRSKTDDCPSSLQHESLLQQPSSLSSTLIPDLAASIVSAPSPAASGCFTSSLPQPPAAAAAALAPSQSQSQQQQQAAAEEEYNLYHPTYDSQYLDAAASYLDAAAASLLHHRQPISSSSSSLIVSTEKRRTNGDDSSSSSSLSPSSPKNNNSSVVVTPPTTTASSSNTHFRNSNNPTKSVGRSREEDGEEVEPSFGFSVLLDQADDRQQQLMQDSHAGRLPVLKEEEEEPDHVEEEKHQEEQKQTSPRISSSSFDGSLILEAAEAPSDGPSSLWPSQQQQQVPQTWYNQNMLAYLAPSSSSNNRRRGNTQSSERRRLATLAGATIRTTGDRSFIASCDIYHNQVSDVLEMIGDPHFLPLWCDAVPHSSQIVIVQSSEGAQTNAIAHQTIVRDDDDNDDHHPDQNRAYEGEWVEATVPGGLSSPSSSSSSYLLRWEDGLFQQMAQCFGCGSRFGHVNMFVERLSNQVSVTMGPFPGRIQVCHRLSVRPVEEEDSSDRQHYSKIKVEDNVRLRRYTEPGEDDNDDAGSFGCCNGGVTDFLQRCFLPTTENYMDQILSSLARLRFLIENGESSSTLPNIQHDANDSLSPLLVHT